MDLKNGYKVIYEKAADGNRTMYAAESTKYPTRNEDGTIADAVLASFVDADFKGKTVYEKDGKFYYADTNAAKFDKDGNPTGTEITFTEGVNPFIEKEEQDNEQPVTQAVEEPAAEPTAEPTTETEDDPEEPVEG
jgi:hypothetical protein